MQISSMLFQQNISPARQAINSRSAGRDSSFESIMSRANIRDRGENRRVDRSIGKDGNSGEKREASKRARGGFSEKSLEDIKELFESIESDKASEALVDFVLYLMREPFEIKGQEIAISDLELIDIEGLELELSNLIASLEEVKLNLKEKDLSAIGDGVRMARDILAALEDGGLDKDLLDLNAVREKMEKLIENLEQKTSSRSNISDGSKREAPVGRELMEADKAQNKDLQFQSMLLGQNFKNQMNYSMDAIKEEYLPVQEFLDIDKLDVIKQISSKVGIKATDGASEIKIKLTPESLGAMTIRVTLEDGVISARAIVENPHVKELLESNIALLRDNLRDQGVNFQKIDVFVGEDPDEGKHPNQSGFEQGSGKRGSRQSSDEIELEDIEGILNDQVVRSDRVDTVV